MVFCLSQTRTTTKYTLSVWVDKITVSAPSVGVSTSTPITISGTITDISPGAYQLAVTKNFPNGLPCVSDASMTQFMEAVYQQQPMPSNITGVPVTVMVTDSNHNTRAIGTTTSNANGFYSLTWKPDIPGNFTVTAVFAGAQSYTVHRRTQLFTPAPQQRHLYRQHRLFNSSLKHHGHVRNCRHHHRPHRRHRHCRSPRHKKTPIIKKPKQNSLFPFFSPQETPRKERKHGLRRALAKIQEK